MRDVRLHTQTMPQTNEKTITGEINGRIGLGQKMTFEGTYFGTRQRLTVKVVKYERARVFVDEMIEGAFKSFKHFHEFIDVQGGTLMRDTLIWASPLGVLGEIADKLVIERHLRDLVSMRNTRLKKIAEAKSASPLPHAR